MKTSNGVRKEYITTSSNQTKKLGWELAKKIAKEISNKERAFVIALDGELGGGKTTFLQGFAKGLGIKEKILSPTFILMKKYEIQSMKYEVRSRKKGEKEKSSGLQSSRFRLFYHIDCYRIQKPEELLNLGFEEIIKDSQNIITIEWADRISKIIPGENIKIKFEFIDKNIRRLRISDKLTRSRQFVKDFLFL